MDEIISNPKENTVVIPTMMILAKDILSMEVPHYFIEEDSDMAYKGFFGFIFFYSG
jgi:hypothetical protein